MREEQHGKREKWINLAFGVLLMLLLLREEHKVESSLLSRRPPNHFLFSLVHDWKSEVVTKAARACSHDTHTHRQKIALLSAPFYECVSLCCWCAGWENECAFLSRWLQVKKPAVQDVNARGKFSYIVAEACEHFVIASISEKNTYIIALHNF